MPSAFELGGAIGSNVAGGIRGAQENSALDQILQQAIQSNDPQVQQDVMRQILTRVSPEKQGAALQILQQKSQQMQQQRQRQALEREGYNPDLPEYINKETAKTKAKTNLQAIEGKDQLQNAFQRTQEILDSGYTGYSWKKLSPEGRKQRAELDTLGEVYISQLIPLLNPRGTVSQARFEYIKGLVPNSKDSDAVIKGKLTALKNIFETKGEGLKEAENTNFVQMRDPSGVIRNIPANQAQAAQAAGGTLVQ